MEKVAYCLQVEDTNCYRQTYRHWFSNNVAECSIGFQELGYEVRGFLAKDLENLPLTKKTPLRAGIKTTMKAFDMLGVKRPENITIPDCLRAFAKRKIYKTTLGHLRATRAGCVHIKPLEIQKGFKGHVTSFFAERGCECEHRWTKNLPDSYKVLASEYTTMHDESRYFIRGTKILDVFGTEEVIFLRKLIANYVDAPASYVVDIARKGNYSNPGEWCLVEINQAYSAGNFGTSPLEYAKCHIARWNEICSHKA